MNLTAIILAGGKSSRMGTDKGLVHLKEIPMVKHVIEAARKANIEEIIIVSNNPVYKQFGFPVYPDIVKDKGPLGGIYTGLQKSNTTRNLILSCDIPFINSDVLNLLVNSHSAKPITVVKHRGIIHNLIGVFDTSLIHELGEHIVSNKLKVGQFIESKNADVIDLEVFLPTMDHQIVANINTMDELKKMEYGM